MTLEDVWRQREEEIYPALFGPNWRGIFPLDLELFTRRFRQSEVDPRWLTCGVFEFAPTEHRASWLYVTSGHSNPWETGPLDYDPTGASGCGVEFTLAAADQGDWAIATLQSMLAFDLLLRAGRYPNAKPLSVHDRIPLRAPLNGQADCVLRNLVIDVVEGFPGEFQLPSGKVRLLGFTGITDAELDYGKSAGSDKLIEWLRAAGYHPVNHSSRPSLL
jgi:hypothetical protein